MGQSVVSSRPSPPTSSWWREPYFWFVVGGPLLVVVAGVLTAYIAMKDPDPVIDKAAIEREALQRAQSQGNVTPEKLVPLQPAQHGRNHAASPVVPKVSAD